MSVVTHGNNKDEEAKHRDYSTVQLPMIKDDSIDFMDLKQMQDMTVFINVQCETNETMKQLSHYNINTSHLGPSTVVFHVIDKGHCSKM